MKLTQEQREAIAVLADSDGWDALKALIDNLVADRQRRVLKYALSEGPQGLVHEKARCEGAELLQAALKSEVERILKNERDT